MDCCYNENKIEDYTKTYDTPVLAGTFRFLLGLLLVFAGLYIATLTNLQGHGLGFLMVFAAPFVALKNDEN